MVSWDLVNPPPSIDPMAAGKIFLTKAASSLVRSSRRPSDKLRQAYKEGRSRMRHFVDGAVIGSRGFVDGVIESLNKKSYWPKPRKSRAAKVKGQQSGIYTLRRLQRE